ncbi:MAG TPA: class I SAM-dependent methyltransferase [Gemmatimonadales bacterium]|nr:class I SAM-dependent methyltransferase [Gemmatimonadales bacterium]
MPEDADLIEAKRGEMLAVNREQRRYYERATGSKESVANSLATNLWRRVRQRVFGALGSAGVPDSVRTLHRAWLGDISRRRLLDLGVGDGNLLSLELAEGAGRYTAIDLSQPRLDRFRERLTEAGILGAELLAVDFLSPEFTGCDYDVIYAMSVLHHFKHPDALLEVLHRRLSPTGQVVTYDPLEIWLPARLARSLYRPFQTDRAWEYPFTKRTLRIIQKYFDVTHVQGFYGRSKWAALAGITSTDLAGRLARRWHVYDLDHANSLTSVGSSLHISLHLTKRRT